MSPPFTDIETRKPGGRRGVAAGRTTGGTVGISRSAASGREHLSWYFHLTWILTLLIAVFGLLMIYSVSTAQGFFADNALALGRLRSQGTALVIGLGALLLLSHIDYRRLRKLTVLGMVVAFAFLVATAVPSLGREGNGAARWLALGPISIQPSEVAKLAFVCVSAHLLSTPRALEGGFAALFWPLGPLMLVAAGLILVQPDLGTAFIVVAVVFSLWWQAGMSLKHWFSAAALAAGGVVLAIFTSGYRYERFLSFRDPFKDPLVNGFQLIQSFVAIARGGLWGVGPGRSIQKFNYLPEAHTDMIFSIVGEEFGLVGAGILILAFCLLVISVLRISASCADPFGRLLAGGVGVMIGVQTIVNLGGVTGLLPLTGVPLPFVSYGRTNLVIMLAAIGLVLGVARHGPVAAGASGRVPAGSATTDEEGPGNVTYLDFRRGHRGPRGARARNR